ncbi:hypothetical protein PLICRDRAFT_180764 [Plicaturopsis crispa FD-325 SS-3]|uniref:DUF6533 domain-containing protein n=1 Tax=Plicaturopsis crispa FD-325 SS-3 TaxID=944288 RepID=A0A0C9SPX1_PLICR|nr:hypothetical protein PLICRDRAFT_180764 [Plicaturopsis crispa FD-325 SS-3]
MHIDESVNLAAVQSLHYSFVGALALLTWDIFITFDVEVEWIWRISNRAVIKWVFLFIRYFSLAFLIAIRVMVYPIEEHTPQSGEMCAPAYSAEFIALRVLQMAVEYVLMLRAYVIYERDIRIALALIALAAMEVTVIIYCLATSLPEVEISPICMILHESFRVVYIGVATMFSQFVILGLSLWKYSQALRRGWGRVPLMTILIRDGALSFIAITGMCIVITVVSFTVNYTISAAVCAWLFAILAVAGCRVIINIQGIPRPGNNVEFTTDVFGDDPLSSFIASNATAVSPPSVLTHSIGLDRSSIS